MPQQREAARRARQDTRCHRPRWLADRAASCRRPPGTIRSRGGKSIFCAMFLPGRSLKRDANGVANLTSACRSSKQKIDQLSDSANVCAEQIAELRGALAMLVNKTDGKSRTNLCGRFPSSRSARAQNQPPNRFSPHSLSQPPQPNPHSARGAATAPPIAFGQVPWLTDGDISIFEIGAPRCLSRPRRWRLRTYACIRWLQPVSRCAT